MQTTLTNEANKTVANLGTTVQLLPAVEKKTATKLEATLDKADKLRINADASYKQYVIAGRDAVITLMGDVYALYCEIKKDTAECKTIIKHMATAVAIDSQVRTTSTDASVLVRYVCREMSDKKVSIYSRCIGLAHTNKIASTGLATLVKSTPDGWNGVLNMYAPAKANTPTAAANVVSSTPQTAEQEVRKEVTVTTISAIDWGNDETVRVYIATYNDDATADIKYVCRSRESIEIVLKRYAAEKKALEKAAKDVKGTTTLSKTAILMIEGDIGNIETEIGNLDGEINAAVEAGQLTRATNLRDKQQVKAMLVKSYRDSLKTAKAAIKEAAAA